MNDNLPNLSDLLSQYEEYNIVGHVRPDGDCIGSAVALSHYLSTIGKRGYIIRNDNISRNFEYFLANTPTLSLENFNHDLPIICVDCSDRARIGERLSAVYDRPFLVIDHHKSNRGFAEHDVIQSSAASTTELLARLFEHEKIIFNKKMAEAIYLGILTDTGRFAYPNTSIDTFRYAQEMVCAGVEPNRIYNLIYENDTIYRYRLLERFLANIELFGDGRACLSHLSVADFVDTGGQHSDTEGFVNYTRSLAGVLIGCYVEFHDDFVKCSMRSVNPHLHLDLLAERLGGGGHACAVGVLTDSRDFSLEHLKDMISKHIDEFYDEYLAAIRE